MADRQRGVQIHRPIIYGSHARLLTEEERATAPPTHTHRWTVFFTSATSPPPKPGQEPDIDDLPGGLDDLSYLVKRVTFRLHETYANPSRVIEKPPYKITETGWGEFTIQIRVQFVNEAAEKPLAFQHGLKLHHWGELVEGPPASLGGADGGGSTTTDGPSGALTPLPTGGEASTPSAARPSATPAAGGNADAQGSVAAGEGDDTTVKAETSTPKPDIVMGDDSKLESTPTSTPAPQSQSQPLRQSQTPAEETHHTRAHTHAQAVADQRVSIAAKWPVLAYQYDEMVFSDPPLTFYNLLNEHPPTKLPSKNRRPRDQREDAEQKKKAKAKANGSGVPVRSSSRQATTEPPKPQVGGDDVKKDGTPAPAVGTPAAGTGSGTGTGTEEKVSGGAAAAGAGTPGPGTPAGGTGPIGQVTVGIPGEPGSADVPLEFTLEMEKAEWNKLHGARGKIIDEMDRWRTKLIEHEKELSKLREEMQTAS